MCECSACSLWILQVWRTVPWLLMEMLLLRLSLAPSLSSSPTEQTQSCCSLTAYTEQIIYMQKSLQLLCTQLVHVEGKSTLPVTTMPWFNQEMELLPRLVRAQNKQCIVMPAVMELSSSHPTCLLTMTELAGSHTGIHVSHLFVSSGIEETQEGKLCHQDCAWCYQSWVSRPGRIPVGSAEGTSIRVLSFCGRTCLAMQWIFLSEKRYEWEVEVYYWILKRQAGYFWSFLAFCHSLNSLEQII